MAYFDFLITKGVAPNSSAEYFYLNNLVWDKDILESKKVKKGIIVHDVTEKENGGYYFKLKNSDKIYECNYAWAFAEVTAENIEALKIFNEKEKEFKLMKKELDELRKKVKTLS